jgi:hypothetical protein
MDGGRAMSNDDRHDDQHDDDGDTTWVGLEPRVGRPRPRTRVAEPDDEVADKDPTERSYRIGRSLGFFGRPGGDRR